MAECSELKDLHRLFWGRFTAIKYTPT